MVTKVSQLTLLVLVLPGSLAGCLGSSCSGASCDTPAQATSGFLGHPFEGVSLDPLARSIRLNDCFGTFGVIDFPAQTWQGPSPAGFEPLSFLPGTWFVSLSVANCATASVANSTIHSFAEVVFALEVSPNNSSWALPQAATRYVLDRFVSDAGAARHLTSLGYPATLASFETDDEGAGLHQWNVQGAGGSISLSFGSTARPGPTREVPYFHFVGQGPYLRARVVAELATESPGDNLGFVSFDGLGNISRFLPAPGYTFAHDVTSHRFIAETIETEILEP